MGASYEVDAFENQVNNAFQESMRTTFALWTIKRALEIEDAGGSVDWELIEDNVWDANEASGFAETYISDEHGVVERFRDIEGD